MPVVNSRSRRLAAAACLALVGLAGAHAGAAEGVNGPKPRSLAVLEVKGGVGTDPKALATLSTLVAAEAAKAPVKVISGSDLMTLLGFEKQKQLMGCTEGSCLAEIGGALGVDFLLSTELGKFGARWIFAVTLLDVAKARAIARTTRKLKSEDEVVDALGGAVDEALRALPVPNGAVRAAPEPKKPPPSEPDEAEGKPKRAAEKPEEAPEPVEAVAEADPGKSRRTAGYVLLAGGGALLVGGAVTGLLAKQEFDDTKGKLAALGPTELQSAKDGVTVKMWIADGLYAAGALAAGIGLIVALTAPSAAEESSSERTTLQFLPIANGGAVVVSGGF